VPVPYMQRTRDYYLALGFGAYRWAHFAEAPFAPLRTPLSQARVGLITTAAPYQPEAGDQGPGRLQCRRQVYQVYSIPTETEPDLRYLACRLRPRAHVGQGHHTYLRWRA